MKTIIIYIVIAILFLGLWVVVSSRSKEICIKKGGQVIEFGLRVGCISGK